MKDIEDQQVLHKDDDTSQLPSTPLPQHHPLFKAFLAFVAGYILYLPLLGPYSALNGSGKLDFLPRVVRDWPYYPAFPIYLFPGLRSVYDDYLNGWHQDPIQADPPTGW